MKRLLLYFLLALTATVSRAGDILFVVEAGEYDRCCTPMDIDISKFGLENAILFETTSGKDVKVECQSDGTRLYFILSGKTAKGSVRTFRIKPTKKTATGNSMGIRDDGNSLTLSRNGKDILSYRYRKMMPPEGVDTVFARSGYIHPACTPSGFVLTTIQPEDHRHHYGIWNPWTKVEYDGQIYDLWNLGDRKGTVRASDIKSRFSGNVIGGFDACLKHIIFQNGSEHVIMDELWKIRTWNLDGDGFLWDFESQLEPITEKSVILKEYRYAGFGFRANKYWTKENCRMISSEGHDRKSIDGTRGRWIFTEGATSDSTVGGFLMIGFPENYNYPEPLRIWDENAAGVGYVFMNFAPTKNMDWQLKPGEKYRLRYRLYAFDGKMSPERAEELWRDAAYPPVIKIISK